MSLTAPVPPTIAASRVASPPRLATRLLLAPILPLSLFVLAITACPPTGGPGGGVTPGVQPSRVTPLIRGYLVTTPTGAAGQESAPSVAGSKGPNIFVPGVEVILRNASTNTVGATVKTDLSGRFTFWAVTAGSYRVCWKAAGYLPGCYSKVIDIRNLPFWLGPVRIAIERPDSSTTLFGTVRMRGGPIRMMEPTTGVNAFAVVRVVDVATQAVLDSALVNNAGEYVLPRVSIRADIRLIARLEGAEETRTILTEFLRSAPSHRVDLTFMNYSPRIDLVSTSGGKRARTASPGAVVRLVARGVDMDGDPVTFRWSLPNGSGTLSATTGGTVHWTLPATPGLHQVFVYASDGKGGYATGTTTVSTTGLGIEFSGKVDATDAPAVPQAEVDVNGKTTLTNAGGFFTLRVPEADRYVLNVRKPGYNLVSRIYPEGVAGGTWTMTRGTVRTVDPKQPIDIADERKYQRCSGSFAQQVDWSAHVEAGRPRYQDGRGNVVRIGAPLAQSRREPRCGPGIRIQIPANALVDESGQPPSGMVDVTLFTVDLRAPFDMPGDYTARGSGGQDSVMESYGAGGVDVTAGGTRYNLRSGATAALTIPIDPDQLAAPAAEPASIPLLSYDERNGVWVREGMMQRVGSNYVGTVRHFSTFNSDLLKQNQACVQVYSPPPQTGFQGLPATSYNLEVQIPQASGTPPRILSNSVDNSVPYHVIYNLPTNTDIVLVPFSPTTGPYGTFIVNTGGPQSPTNPNLPPYPYQACRSTVTLFDVDEPAPATDAFLHGLYSFAAANLTELQATNPALAADFDAATGNYYAQIDPRSLRTTFSAFQQKNGFTAGGDTRAIFANSVDLGFGRDMHCKKTTASDGLEDIACYVTNYGNETTPDNADFQNAVDGIGAIATVAMEYSRIENPPGPTEFDPGEQRAVKFYVYAQPAGTLLRAANLDGRGARPVPQLCMVCHGGEYATAPSAAGVPVFNSRTSVKLGSVFIPFDLNAFTIVDGYNPAWNKANQQVAFKAFNQDMVLATQPGAVPSEIITGMYNPPTASTQTENFVVAGWNANPGRQAMYLNVIRQSCRMCHGSRPQPAAGSQELRFHQAVDFAALGGIPPFRVCTERVMPHALITYNRFWQSIGPHQPAQFKAFGDAEAPGTYGTSCVTPQPSPPNPVLPTFANTLAPRLVTSCALSGCHVPPNPPRGLDLSAAVAYANIVNVPSQQLPAMNLITPGNALQSYLMHKLDGTQASVGGSGAQMPRNATPLSQGERDQIRDWIQQGAVP